MSNESISVYITVKFRIDDVCSDEDLIEDKLTLDKCVRSIVEEDLWGVVNLNDLEILKIERCEDK